MQNLLEYWKNVVFDMRFSNIFKQLFPRIRLTDCYLAQNTKSKTHVVIVVIVTM